jgi:ABC-type dipeptide/oligopeptide/nickel transport systems, permease components
MTRYLGKRAITAVVCVALVLVINFALIRLAPGNPARLLVGTETPTAEQVQLITEKYGLDKPLPVQFLVYVGNLLRGDLGVSYYTNEPVAQLIGEKLANTAILSLSGLFLSVLIGTLMGIVCARRVGGKLDNIFSGITYFVDSFPSFWLGLMLMLIFSVRLGVLPKAGMFNVREDFEGLRYALDVMKHMILPVGTLTILQIPYFFRISRSAMIQTMGEDFITTLRASGMPEGRIFRKYVFRNSILPTVTAVSIFMAYVVTGSALVEIVFSWPGMGSFVMTNISRRDYPVLMGIYLMLSISVAIVMIAVDVLYSFLDPRVSHGGRA